MKNLKREKDFVPDRIQGDTIILYDPCEPGEKVLKKVRIIARSGEIKRYEIRRTAKGGYLFN
jgi:hypothetical protein